ncbi:hypothetical protein AB0K05_35375 [Nonomuraea sp. NPDC049486]
MTPITRLVAGSALLALGCTGPDSVEGPARINVPTNGAMTGNYC